MSLKASVYFILTAHFDFDLATLQVFNGHVQLVATAMDPWTAESRTYEDLDCSSEVFKRQLLLLCRYGKANGSGDDRR